MKGKGKHNFRAPGGQRGHFVRGRGVRAFVAIGRKKQDSTIEVEENRNIVAIIDFVGPLKEKVSSQIGPSNRIKCIKKYTLTRVFLIRDIIFHQEEAYSTDKEFINSNEFDNFKMTAKLHKIKKNLSNPTVELLYQLKILAYP